MAEEEKTVNDSVAEQAAPLAETADPVDSPARESDVPVDPILDSGAESSPFSVGRYTNLTNPILQGRVERSS